MSLSVFAKVMVRDAMTSSRCLFTKSKPKATRRQLEPKNSLKVNRVYLGCSTRVVSSQLRRSGHCVYASNSLSMDMIPKSKVELHMHLDAAIRHDTIISLARENNIPLPSYSSDELKKLISIPVEDTEKCSLTKFLRKFAIFMPTITGNLKAIERVAYEWCEDSAKHGIVYSEVRYSPHYLIGDSTITPHQVVKAVNRGIALGSKGFSTKVNTILCCIRHMPEWSAEILSLCKEFQGNGVVGIDLAGDEKPAETHPTQPEHIHVFQEAAKCGIHRTVHAGENGSAKNVEEAIDLMHAERVGHAYHVLDNADLYARVLRQRIHLEVCPISSFITGSVPQDALNHPLRRFVKDEANFSINSDDPLLTGGMVNKDYQFVLEQMQLNKTDLQQSSLNAARSSFLPEAEKQQLIDQLTAEYSM